MSLLIALSIFGIGHAVVFPHESIAFGEITAYAPCVSWTGPRCGIAGVILTDSISILGPPPRRSMLPDLLLRVYQETGGCFAGFCIPGASIAPAYRREGGRSLLYVEALAIALEYLSVSSVGCILIVSGGNDFYRRAMYHSGVDVQVFRSFFRGHARVLLYALTDATDTIGMVLGGSAAAWNYDEPVSWVNPLLYDEMVRMAAAWNYDLSVSWVNPLLYDEMVRMACWCWCLAVWTTSGYEEFRRLRLYDRMGHVHHTSGPALVGMLLQWVLQLYKPRPMSKL